MSKEIPILFSTPMVQAILQGRKTVTRRVVKLPEAYSEPLSPDWRIVQDKNYPTHWRFQKDTSYTIPMFRCPYGKPGDVIWVRESWSHIDNTQVLAFRADDCDWSDIVSKWKPSIHMPKATARIWLEVVSVRVERLHDITEEQAIAEGVERATFIKENDSFKFYHDMKLEKTNPVVSRAIDSFISLWQLINGKESVKANPWVWVVEFRVLSTTGKPETFAVQMGEMVTDVNPNNPATIQWAQAAEYDRPCNDDTDD